MKSIMSKSSVFRAHFFRLNKDIEIDGLINCIEMSKKECALSGLEWENVTFLNVEDDKILSKYLIFKKDLFSNKMDFAMKES